jgi:hypothetical protein
MLGMIAHDVEQRFAHVEHRAIEHDGVGVFVGNELVDGRRESGGRHLVAAVAERKRQELGDLGRVVNQDYAAGRHIKVQGLDACSSLFFFPAAGSRSRTHTRPPAV